MRNKKGQEAIIGLGILGVAIVVGAFIVLLLGFDTVDASHEGVMIQFGKILGTMDPGMQWTGVFTHVEQYDLRTRKAVIELAGANSAVDKTGQAVYATIAVNYRVKPQKETVTNLYSKIGTDSVIADRLNLDAIIIEGFKQATVKYDALEILDKRQEVKQAAVNNIRANFPSEYFEIQDIVISNIDFSEGFKNAIDQKKIAEQNALKEQNQVDVVKFQQQQEIEKYKAEAEKLRLQKSQITALLIQQQWVSKWDGHLPSYMMTTPENANALLQIPVPSSGFQSSAVVEPSSILTSVVNGTVG